MMNHNWYYIKHFGGKSYSFGQVTKMFKWFGPNVHTFVGMVETLSDCPLQELRDEIHIRDPWAEIEAYHG